MYKVAVIVASDKGYAGTREDKSGAYIVGEIRRLNYEVEFYKIVPDDRDILRDMMIQLSDVAMFNLILTSGGTGLSPRDVTPEATSDVCDKFTPGISELLRIESYKVSPRAALSRAVSGIRGRTLIVNLPGSLKAVQEQLNILTPLLKHALDILNEKDHDCGDIPNS